MALTAGRLNMKSRLFVKGFFELLVVAVVVTGCTATVDQAAKTVGSSGLATVNGARIYYETVGTGPDVILIHGFTLDTRMWDAQIPELSKHYRVTRFDLRGHGKSDGATTRFDNVDDLRALMDFLHINKAHIVGLSLGGEIAANFVLTHPTRAVSMTLIDAYYPPEPGQTEEFDERIITYVTDVEQIGLEAGLHAWFNDAIFESARANQKVRPELEEIILRGHLAQGSGALFTNVGNEKQPETLATHRLAEYRLPTLILVGEYDLPRFHGIADRFASGIAEAEKVVIPRAGHMSNMENAEVVTQRLLAFLDGTRR
jgi:pimeloyl-ACP methyl ester carboxylesterase